MSTNSTLVSKDHKDWNDVQLYYKDSWYATFDTICGYQNLSVIFLTCNPKEIFERVNIYTTRITKACEGRM